MPDATIRDVARQAAVSVASVSRALNGHSNVHPDTRARVVAAAKSLGYVPHAGARSLSMARTNAIGVVLPDLHGEFFSEMVRGIDSETGTRGYHLLFASTHADIDLAGQAMRSLRGRVDGLIVMAPQLDADDLEAMLPGGIPTILVNAPEGSGHAVVGVDNRAGVEAMVAHLLAGGRRALVHVTGPAGNLDARERYEGFVAAMAARAPGAPVRVIEGDFSEAAGERAVARLLDEGVRFDAILAANDMMALGALQALRAAGIAVPDAVAVAGFDDIPLARFLALTTMRVRVADLGARAVSRLFDAFGEAAAPTGFERFTPELVVRATTAGDARA